jgi:hypothetical protein
MNHFCPARRLLIGAPDDFYTAANSRTAFGLGATLIFEAQKRVDCVEPARHGRAENGDQAFEREQFRSTNRHARPG